MAAEPTDDARADHAGVRIPPPIIYLVCLIAGLAIDSPWRTGALASPAAGAAGAALVVLGLAAIVSAAVRQRRAGTNVEPWRTTTALVAEGVYRFTRNPMYLGMTICYVGLAIAGGSIAAFATLVPALLIVRYYVIAREERYLAAKFGEIYSDYRKRVRRWM